MGSMFDDIPSLIQDPDPPQDSSLRARDPAPLVLIHDGGGTIFSYYCLGELDRQVFGIANPNYESGDTWPGGIPEMARHYLKYIKSAVPRGDIIIGGWSMGGLISLEVARQLADDRDKSLNLLGIVMVDSVCPLVLTAPLLPLVQHAVQWGEHTRQETKDRVMHCFSEAFRMVREWKLPEWEDRKQNGVIKGPLPPPVVLLRAMEPVPVPETGISRVDVHRGDRVLGWRNYRKDLITKALDVPGHHFNLFHTEETLDATTEGIRKACLEIEMMSSRGPWA